MKDRILQCAAAACISAFLLAGCAGAEAPASEGWPQRPDDFPQGSFQPEGRPFFPGGGRDMQGRDLPGQMPADPGEVSTLPVTDPAELFSSSDLDGSPDLQAAEVIPLADDSSVSVTGPGCYLLTGQAKNFTLRIEAGSGDQVRVVLRDAEIVNSDFPVIYVKSADKCFVTLLGDNSLSVSGGYASDGDVHTDAVIFSRADLTLNGSGSLHLTSAAGNGIAAKDELKIAGGAYQITAARNGLEANDAICIYSGSFTIDAGKDAVRCKSGSIQIRDGSFALTAADDGLQATELLAVCGGSYQITAAEGLEATYVQINGGSLTIRASDDGINAARKSDACDVVIEINGGEITVVMGAGDTDGLDANGTIIVNGGSIDVTGNSAFDADRGSIYNGGSIVINGVQVDAIPISDMGGWGGGRWNREQPGDWQQPGGRQHW